MENVGLKNASRILLEDKDIELKFQDVKKKEYTYKISVDSLIGEGSSCACYSVTVYKGEDELGQKRILKQFYPDPQLYEIDADMNGMELNIQGFHQNAQIQKLGEVFEKTYYTQIDLAKKIPGIIVKPDLNHFAESTKYILFDSDGGETLDKENFNGIEEMIGFFYEFAVALEKLHRKNVIHMDLKPENVLWIDKKNVKFFDFDASVNMNELEEVHEIRGDSNHIELLAPELRKCKEFEQNKGIYLTPRVDIYSFGAILFSCLLDKYPSIEDCNSRNYEKKLYEFYNSDLCRGKLTEEEQNSLNNIIWKCIQSDLSIDGRYVKTKDLTADIRRLYYSVNSPITERRRQFQTINTRLQAAYVMDKNPLTKYRKRTEHNSYVMDVLIAGEDTICNEFFKNIYACAQMLSTELHIHLASQNAEERMNKFITEWPLLSKTTKIYLNEEEKKSAKDISITKQEFAKVYFYEWDSEVESVTELYKKMNKDKIYTSWIIIAGTDNEKNIEQTKELTGYLEKYNEKVFIGYLDGRGDGYELRKLDSMKKEITLFPFSNNNKYSLDESEFAKGIRGQALLLHKYYMREWSERANKREIWKDFSSSSYNIMSSLCSVLSIPYKLESVNIKMDGKNSAVDFYCSVLASKDETKLNKLIYLEHRRWMCFMVTEGYNRPTVKQMEDYMFSGKNDQRDKDEKLHPMISDSSIDKGIMLCHLPHHKWKETNLLGSDEFDELDKMSLRIHQFCDRKTSQMSLKEGELKEKFDAIEREMSQERFEKSELLLLNTLKIICQRMLDNESNINLMWGKICKEFADMLEKSHKNSRVNSTFQELKNSMRVVEERNKYHDYKSSDRTILEALPFLLTSDNPIRRIHKPVGESIWQDVISSLIIEPEELILYADDVEKIDKRIIQSFLKEDRGYNTKVSVRQWKEFQKLKITNKTVKSIVDITGVKTDKAFEIANIKELNKLPIVLLKNGKLNGLKGFSEVEFFKVIRRHLTVKETFQLFHANVYSRQQENLMISLRENYQNLWNVYINTKPFFWRVLVEFLRETEQKNYWRIEEKEENTPITKQYIIPRRQISDAKIDKLLYELKEKQLVQKYSLPEKGQTGKLKVQTKNKDIARFLDKMIEKTKAYPYLHQFYFMETKREVISGKPLQAVQLYIKDETLVVDEEFEDLQVDNSNENKKDCQKEWKSKIIKATLENLIKENKNDLKTIIALNDAPVIANCGKGNSVFRVRFVYKDEQTKECLMKEGNILEACVYHTIWKNALVDDVQMNVSFVWDSENEEDSLLDTAITNEIDLVCTKDLQTYFISCKQSPIKMEHLQEIKYFADYFGVEGKAIIICSNWQTSNKSENRESVRVANRSKKMDVYYIDRTMIGNYFTDFKKENLAKYIQNIMDGKEDWEDIEE